MAINYRSIPIGFGASVRVEVDTTELDRRTARMVRQAEEPQMLWAEVGGIMRASFSRNFAVGGRPAWAPLKASTIKKKARAGLPARTAKGNVPTRLMQNGQFSATNILIEQGLLRDSYAQKNAKGHVERVEEGGNALFIGSQLTRERPGRQRPLRIPVRRGKLTANAIPRIAANRIVALARVHHRGNPKGNLPARPVAVVQDEDRTSIRRAAVIWLKGGL